MNNETTLSFAIDNGTTKIFDHIENAGPMWSGNGKRWARGVIQFDELFDTPPAVQLSIAMIDADSNRNLRLELHADDVSAEGFTAVAHTWSDTHIGRLHVNWTAIGQRRSEATALWEV